MLLKILLQKVLKTPNSEPFEFLKISLTEVCCIYCVAHLYQRQRGRRRGHNEEEEWHAGAHDEEEWKEEGDEESCNGT